MTRYACGYCTHSFESEDFPRECPNCEKCGPFYYVFTLSDEDYDLESGVIVTVTFDISFDITAIAD